MTLCIAVIGTSDQSCWLAEACKILLLLLPLWALSIIYAPFWEAHAAVFAV